MENKEQSKFVKEFNERYIKEVIEGKCGCVSDVRVLYGTADPEAIEKIIHEQKKHSIIEAVKNLFHSLKQ